MSFEPIEFESDGTLLRGRLYLPSEPARPATGRLPVAVMAHGFSATIPMVLDRYAEVFQAAGVAALAFDHPGFGRSDGEPRHEVNAYLQARGYLAAVRYARSRLDLDPRRLALWGDSASARHVLGIAVVDASVAAIVVQVPACGSSYVADRGDVHVAAMRAHLLGGEVRGPVDGWISKPVVSVDQARQPSALEPLTAYRWFIEYGGRYGSGWANDCIATGNPAAPAWDTQTWAARVQAPTLFVISPDDEMPGAETAVARETFRRVPGPKELVEVDGGHFGLLYYPSPEFDRASAAEAAFLRRVLVDGAAP